MAKKNSPKKRSGVLPALSRTLSLIWRSFAKSLGATVRVITRGAKDLDPEHRRDGFGLLLFILALIAAATTWWQLENWFGNAAYAFFYGAVGR
ncbi:MAG: hypothetical protein RL590_1328, partial [Actinomycetota bacterium]